MDEKRLVDGTTALAEKQARVIKIEPTERPQNVRLRVAAYTRVSSDSEDQLNSFAAQNRYYTELISGKAEWRMVDIYADEGITGTSVAKRDDFQRMMADCRRGLIDQVLVKSISRFARNTKDCLQNIRELKELGVNVRFEREGIDTVNVSSELITAIYAAFAQKESESISGNMRWSYQRRMEQGTFNTYAWGVRLAGGTDFTGGIYRMKKSMVRRIGRVFLLSLCVGALTATTAYAAGDDPLAIVNNLSDFIFSIIKAVGIIILGWGVVQVGMSIQSHDASQRTQGLLCLFGGLLIAFAKEILTLIGAV